MKIRTVKKVIKEFLIKRRKTPLARKVRLDNELAVYFYIRPARKRTKRNKP